MTVDISANQFIQELLDKVEERFQSLRSYKKKRLFFDSQKMKNAYFKAAINILVEQKKINNPDIEVTREDALKGFDLILKRRSIHKYCKDETEKKKYFDMANLVDVEKDENNKKTLQDELDKYEQNLLDKISPEDKEKAKESFIKKQVFYKQMQFKNKSEINRKIQDFKGYNKENLYNQNEGYCLKSLTFQLYKLNEKYKCLDFLPNDLENILRVTLFIKEMENNEKTKNHLYQTTENTSILDIIEKQEIKPGAIVVLNNSKGQPKHAMFYSGEINEKGEKIFTEFNMESKERTLKSDKEGKPYQGYVLDVNNSEAKVNFLFSV